MANDNDIKILRDLAKQYAEIASKPIQDERRDLWRKHNSLVRTRPPVLALWWCGWHTVPQSKLHCEDRFFQGHEKYLRQRVFQDTIGDDYVIEPWIPMRARVVMPPGGAWGMRTSHTAKTDPEGTWGFDPCIKTLEDADQLAEPKHVVDEEATALNLERLQDAIGDIVEITVDRSPGYGASFCTPFAILRGFDQYMWDMVDNPEWLHRVTKFMSDGILRTHDEAEAAGHWRLCNHGNQAMPYAQELPDPQASDQSVKRDQLWTFVCAQEMALISPAMHDEFVLQYQRPIMEKFGLVAYGCCEDLTEKIDILRKVPNMRRIGITPWADVGKCAEQMGEDFVMSWRPNPAQMICCGFDADQVRRIVKDAMDAAKGCHVDITLKDVQTVLGQPENLARWVEAVRSVSDEYA